MTFTSAAFRKLQRNAAAPERASKRRKPPALRERDVQRAIEDYLTCELGPEGVGWFRLNSGMAAPIPTGDPEVDARQLDRRIRLAPAGTADLLAIIPRGRIFRPIVPTASLDRYRWDGERRADFAVPFFIEVKSPGGKTERRRALLQSAFRDEMMARSCIAIEARSLNDVVAILPVRRVR
jgi:hypothetical protein